MSALPDLRWEHCVMLWISPGFARPKTLIPVEFGTKSTYEHAHIVKMNSSYVKILQSSYKVPSQFPQLCL